MVGIMAEINNRTDSDDLVLRARTDADALGRLYELYYECVFKFCVHRLFNKQIAEDITSEIFLQVARQIKSFPGRTEDDFRNWLYAIAANHANAFIRKSSRRAKLLEEVAASMSAEAADCSEKPDWPQLYSAILKLKPKYQTIITLRFFENMDFVQIAKIINAGPATVRITLHRILKKLRNHLQKMADEGV
jgi:RNA polymerase sigma-70 factor (ECF subfamily)